MMCEPQVFMLWRALGGLGPGKFGFGWADGIRLGLNTSLEEACKGGQHIVITITIFH